MLTQAKVLRLAALLVLHRLRFAFGTHADKATAISRSILDELHLMIQLTGRSVPFVDFAYLIASFEITDPRERVAALAESYLIVDFSARAREELENWLISFWAARDDESGHDIYWEDVQSCIFA